MADKLEPNPKNEDIGRTSEEDIINSPDEDEDFEEIDDTSDEEEDQDQDLEA